MVNRRGYGYATGTPFQTLEYTHHGLAGIVRTLSLECDIQGLAYIETVFGQLHGILVVDHLVLVAPPMRIYGLEQSESTHSNEN